MTEDICIPGGQPVPGDMQAFYGTKEYTLIPKVVAKTSDDTELLRLRRAMDDYKLLSPQPTPPETILTTPQVRGSESEPRHQPTFDNRNCIVLPRVLEQLAQQVRDLPMRTRPLTGTHAAEEIFAPPQLPQAVAMPAVGNLDIKSWLILDTPALEVYTSVFVDAGYDDTAALKEIESEEERQELLANLDVAGIKKPHRRKIDRMLDAITPR